jgi:hypothetical protein
MHRRMNNTIQFIIVLSKIKARIPGLTITEMYKTALSTSGQLHGIEELP